MRDAKQRAVAGWTLKNERTISLFARGRADAALNEVETILWSSAQLLRRLRSDCGALTEGMRPLSSSITSGTSRLVIAVSALVGASFTTVPALGQTVDVSADADAAASGTGADADAKKEGEAAAPTAPAEAVAEEEKAEAPPAPVPEDKAEPAEPPQAPPPPAPVPEAKPKPEPPKAPLFQVYGILKPEVIVSKGVETYGKAMMVAPTAAAHPIADPNFAEVATSFQLQQSRLGLKINDGGPVSGRLEIDFIDDSFSHSSPIQGAGLRLRLAYVTYKPGVAHTLQVGQAWDIFSPLKPQTMNMVGLFFESGNSAFLRPQVVYTYGKGQGLEVSAATGLRAQNVTQALNAVELGMLPTFAVQVGWRKDKNWLGVSGIIGAEEAAPPPNRAYNVAAAANVFANIQMNDKMSVILEGYVGQNTAALGLITLGSGAKVIDVGGFMSASFKLDKKLQTLWFTVGAAGVLNPTELAIGYNPAVPATATTPAVAASRSTTSVGIEGNANIRATYIISPLEGLQFYAEPFLFLTRHKLLNTDDPTGVLANRVAPGLQIGTRYDF